MRHINYDVLNDLAEILEEDFPKIIESFITSSSNILETIPVSLINDDINSFALKIHSLKGSCRNIGAECLADLCMCDEENVKNNRIDQIDPSLKEIRKEFEFVQRDLLAYLSSQ
jgi:HPt (histidine-containing phosphotransfer) domain-containing protein